MTKYIPYIIIAVLLVSLIFSLTNRKEVVIETKTSDTVVVVKLDTVKVEKPTFITEVIVDTFFIEKSENDAYIIPKTQRYYKTDEYEAWVSGYKPNLDSIYTFNKTITNDITNTITREIYPKTTDFYLNAGADYINGQFAPNVGASVKFKRDIMLSGSVGLYDKSVYYGLKIGFKLNRNGK